MSRPTTASTTTEKINQTFFQVVKEKPRFTADDIYAASFKFNIAPRTLASELPNLFKTFKAAGFIRRTDEFVESPRNGKALRVWASRGEPKATKLGPDSVDEQPNDY